MKELQIIQTKLKAPKNQINKFGGYKYRSCEDIVEAVKPLLSENECTLTVSDDIIMVGTRIYVKAIATLTNSSGEKEQCSAFAREEDTRKGMDVAQVTGSASSYARKYALNGLFCIDDTQDPDSDKLPGKDTQDPEKKTGQKQVKDIRKPFTNDMMCDKLYKWLHDSEEKAKKTNPSTPFSFHGLLEKHYIITAEQAKAACAGLVEYEKRNNLTPEQ